MAVVDTLVTRYVMDNADYKRGAADVAKATQTMGQTVASSFGSLKNVTAIGLIITALAALPAAFLHGAQAASTAGMEFEAQTKALSLYADEVNTTEKMLAQLREVAKLPGLGNIEAIQSAVRLLAGGFDFTLSVRSMMAFGNALAAAGKGKEDLDGVIMALTQIAAKGKVSAEEINQIAERVPQIRTAMKEAFGTANTEDLQKMGISAEAFILGVVKALESLPNAAGGMKNTLSNLQDMFNTALADIGMGINKYLVNPLNEVVRFGEYLKSMDVFAKIGEQFGQLFNPGNGNVFVNLTAILVATLEELPAILNKVRYAVELVRLSFVDFYNKIASSRIGQLMGLDQLDPNSGLGIGANIVFGKNFDNIRANARKYAEGYQSYNPDPFSPGTGGSIAGSEDAGPTKAESEMEKHTTLLSSIERNTNPQRNTILGGGNLGAQGISATDLSRIKAGRRKVDQLARLLQEMMSEEAANQSSQFIRMASPFVSGR